MRIVAGAHRGRPLVAPKGHSTRPTADRAREATFNILEHAAWSPGLAGRSVLDLFAGSGALGLEALSRGASFCRFADTDPHARQAIDENLRNLRLTDRALVSSLDARRLGPAAQGERYDLVLLDPPYGRGLAEPALSGLLAGGWLAPGAIMVVERGAAETPSGAPGFDLVDCRRWGAAAIEFLRLASTPAE